MVPSGATVIESSVDECRLRITPKMTNPMANNAAKVMSRPLLVLKKLRKSRGFMAGLLVNEGDERECW